MTRSRGSKRRRYITASLAVALLTGLPRSEAQQLTRVPRIGILWHAGSEAEEDIFLHALKDGLRQFGYIDGRTVLLENRFAAEQYERFNSQAAELAALKVDALVAVTTPAALAAKRATTTIPIVFVIVPDPVSAKLVDSLARPGANLTGISTYVGPDVASKRLQLFKDAVPTLSRVAVLVNPANPTHRTLLDATRSAQGTTGVSIQAFESVTPHDLEHSFAGIRKQGMNGVLVLPDGMFHNERRRIAALSSRARLPTMVFNREGVEAGNLMSYGPSVTAMFRRAAYYVDRILKGAKPSDLPVEQPTKFELVINVKTAKSLGFTIPRELLLRTDEMID